MRGRADYPSGNGTTWRIGKPKLVGYPDERTRVKVRCPQCVAASCGHFIVSSESGFGVTRSAGIEFRDEDVIRFTCANPPCLVTFEAPRDIVQALVNEAARTNRPTVTLPASALARFSRAKAGGPRREADRDGYGRTP